MAATAAAAAATVARAATAVATVALAASLAATAAATVVVPAATVSRVRGPLLASVVVDLSRLAKLSAAGTILTPFLSELLIGGYGGAAGGAGGYGASAGGAGGYGGEHISIRSA